MFQLPPEMISLLDQVSTKSEEQFGEVRRNLNRSADLQRESLSGLNRNAEKQQESLNSVREVLFGLNRSLAPLLDGFKNSIVSNTELQSQIRDLIGSKQPESSTSSETPRNDNVLRSIMRSIGSHTKQTSINTRDSKVFLQEIRNVLKPPGSGQSLINPLTTTPKTVDMTATEGLLKKLIAATRLNRPIKEKKEEIAEDSLIGEISKLLIGGGLALALGTIFGQDILKIIDKTFGTQLSPLFEKILAPLAPLKDIIQDVSKYMVMGGMAIKSFAGYVLSLGKTMASGPRGVLKAFATVKKDVRDLVTSMKNGVKSVATGLKGIPTFISGIGTKIKGLFTGGIKGFFKGAMSGIASMFTGGAKAAATAVTKGGTGLLKTLFSKSLSKIPIVGSLMGLFFAYNRFKEGNIVGGLFSLASALASFIPGIGTAISIVIDLLDVVVTSKANETGASKGSSIIPAIKGIFEKIGNGLLFLIKWPFKMAWKLLKGLFSIGSEIFGPIFQGLKDFYMGIFSGYGKMFKLLFSYLGDAVVSVWEKLKDIFSSIGDLFTGTMGFLSDVFKKIGSTISNAWNSMKDLASRFASYLGRLVLDMLPDSFGIRSKAAGLLGLNDKEGKSPSVTKVNDKEDKSPNVTKVEVSNSEEKTQKANKEIDDLAAKLISSQVESTAEMKKQMDALNATFRQYVETLKENNQTPLILPGGPSGSSGGGGPTEAIPIPAYKVDAIGDLRTMYSFNNPRGVLN
jgi:hypothetical protein